MLAGHSGTTEAQTSLAMHRIGAMPAMARHHPVLSLAFLAVAASAGANAGEPQRYQVDPVHTRVVFAIDHAGFSKAIGTISGSTGSLRFDPDDWQGTTLDVSVPMSKLDMGDSGWTASVSSRLARSSWVPKPTNAPATTSTNAGVTCHRFSRSANNAHRASTAAIPTSDHCTAATSPRSRRQPPAMQNALPSGSVKLAHQLVSVIGCLPPVTVPPSSTTRARTSSIESTST